LGEWAPGIASDGSGGAILAWQDRDREGAEHPHVLRMLEDGTPAPGWPAGGMILSPGPTAAPRAKWLNGYPIRYSSIVADGSGGAYVAWTATDADTGDVFVQLVLGDGT